jgi:hypothetical protein
MGLGLEPALVAALEARTEGWAAGLQLAALSARTRAGDVLTAAVGGHPRGDIGGMQALFLASGIGYPLGGLLFGIALFRAGILSRWASVLLAYGTTSALALAFLPESFNRPFAVPTGVALIGLGVSLWREQRAPAAVWAAEPVAA